MSGAKWTLRDGTEADVRAAYELDLVCFEAPYRFSQRTMRGYAMAPEAVFAVAERGSGLVGFVVAELERGAGQVMGYVATIDVHPAWRRKGVAAALLREAEQRMAAAGAETMLLHVAAENAGAIGFYERLGYRRLAREEDFYAPGLGAYVYGRRLEG